MRNYDFVYAYPGGWGGGEDAPVELVIYEDNKPSRRIGREFPVRLYRKYVYPDGAFSGGRERELKNLLVSFSEEDWDTFLMTDIIEGL